MHTPRRETLLDLFDSFAGHRGTYLVFDDGLRNWNYSYAQVRRAALRLAIRFRAEGVQPGTFVVLYAQNRPEWVVAFWACLLTGAAAVPVDFRASKELFERVRSRVGATLTLDEEALRKIEWPAEEPPFERSPGELAEVVFTSGATGEPRGVEITHSNLLANLRPIETEIRKYRQLAIPFRPIRFLNLLPMSHLFGQVMAVFIPPMLGGEVIFTGSQNPQQLIRLIRERRISVAVCVPKTLELLRLYAAAEMPVSEAAPPSGGWVMRWWFYREVHNRLGWKFWCFIVGAAPLPVDTEEFWSKLAFLVIQGYGLTETAPIVTLNHPFHSSKGTVGTPVAGVEVRLAEDGEVLVRGGNVSRGYFGESTRNEEWLPTGDIGQLDQDGRLAILGRKKEMIVTPEGMNVFPEDVEQVLLRVRGVRDAAVVGDERPRAVVVVEPGTDLEEVRRLANERLEAHQRIASISPWPDEHLPRTEGTNKLQRLRIKQGLRAETQGVGGNRLDELLRRLQDSGLSSLERVEVELELEQQGARAIVETPSPVSLPRWAKQPWAVQIRKLALPAVLLPLTRVFASIRVHGGAPAGTSPVLFASNHQSHLDVPVLLSAIGRERRGITATAMAREFFAPWRVRDRLLYYLACLFFHGYPLPRVEAGASESLHYMGELVSLGHSLIVFPEGKMTDTGEIETFRPGVGLIAARLELPIVPVRIEGLDHVLHRSWRFPRRGVVRVRFGPLLQAGGKTPEELAQQVEAAVRGLA